MTRPRRAASLVAAVLLVGGCAPPVEPPSAQPTTESTRAGLEPTTAPTVATERTDVEATEGADHDGAPDAAVLRLLQDATVRVRASGCGQVGTGSGFMLEPWLLVTNRHVVDNATRTQLTTWDGVTVDGAFVGVAFYSDLALVALDDELAATLPLAEHDPPPGEPILIAGYPGGGLQALEEGSVVNYVDARDVDFPDNVGKLMRLDATVQRGNSGGPVVNHDGDVVGVVYALQRDGSRGLAVPVSTLRRFANPSGNEEPELAPPLRC